jgi:elongation factor G
LPETTMLLLYERMLPPSLLYTLRIVAQRNVRVVNKSTAAVAPIDYPSSSPLSSSEEQRRLERLRNVGIFAHIDAGKTTVTERCLALTGIVRRAGSVDDGNTVTDYLPAERERGITISAAAISFPWKVPSSGLEVDVNLIDTPGELRLLLWMDRWIDEWMTRRTRLIYF